MRKILYGIFHFVKNGISLLIKTTAKLIIEITKKWLTRIKSWD